jgi:hypothetical protein
MDGEHADMVRTPNVERLAGLLRPVLATQLLAAAA